MRCRTQALSPQLRGCQNLESPAVGMISGWAILMSHLPSQTPPPPCRYSGTQILVSRCRVPQGSLEHRAGSCGELPVTSFLFLLHQLPPAPTSLPAPAPPPHVSQPSTLRDPRNWPVLGRTLWNAHAVSPPGMSCPWHHLSNAISDVTSPAPALPSCSSEVPSLEIPLGPIASCLCLMDTRVKSHLPQGSDVAFAPWTHQHLTRRRAHRVSSLDG